jgi:serine/threonine protein kinase
MLQTRRELETLKMCKHPNIVSLIDYIENEESLYLVIDYYEGGDLYDYML